MNFKQNLISSLKLIVYYVCANIVFCVALAALYMIYMLCINLVAGQPLHFDAKLFAEGLLLFEPIVMVFSAMLMSFFMIRHPGRDVMQLVVYAAIYVSFWLFCIPAVVKCNIGYSDKFAVSHEAAEPSSGYFRKSGDKIFYYSSISDSSSGNAVANGVCIDTSKAGNSVYTFSGLVLPEKNAVFTDPLIENTIEMPVSLYVFVHYGSELLAILKKCVANSFACWLCFATMGLPLLAVVGIRRFSKWRLVSVITMVIITVGIILLNIAGYTNARFVSVENSINGVLSNIPPVRALASVGNPCVMLFNILLFIALAVFFVVFEIKEARELASGSSFYGDD